MKSIFETRGAVFEPSHITTVQEATRQALDELNRERTVTEQTAAKLGKVLIALARERLKKGRALTHDTLAGEAVAVIRNLWSHGLID